MRVVVLLGFKNTLSGVKILPSESEVGLNLYFYDLLSFLFKYDRCIFKNIDFEYLEV